MSISGFRPFSDKRMNLCKEMLYIDLCIVIATRLLSAKEFSFALSIVFLTVVIILFKKKNNRYIHLTLSLVRRTFSVSVNFCDKDS
jgi:hypothetical protein